MHRSPSFLQANVLMVCPLRSHSLEERQEAILSCLCGSPDQVCLQRSVLLQAGRSDVNPEVTMAVSCGLQQLLLVVGKLGLVPVVEEVAR